MKKMISFLILFIISMTPLTIQAQVDIDFEELFENHQSVMMIIHVETGDIINANQAAATFYGYALDVMIGMNISEINTLTPDQIAAEMQKAVLEERNFFMFKHRLSNGEIRDVHVYSYPVEIDGETYLYSVIIDQTAFVAAQAQNRLFIATIITVLSLSVLFTTFFMLSIRKEKNQLKQAHEKIYDQEKTKEVLLSNLPGVAYRCLHDENWTMLFMSKKIIELSGYEPEEFYTGKIQFKDLIEVSYRHTVLESFNASYLNMSSVEVVYPIQTKDNQTKWVRDVAKFVGKDQDQQEIIEGFIEDITEQQEITQKAKYFKNMLEYIIKSGDQGIAVHDQNMNYVYVSQRYLDMYGLKEKNIIGKNHYEIFPDLPMKWREVHQKTLKGEVHRGDRDPYVRQDGTTDYTRWSSMPWYIEDGTVGGIIIYTEIINDLIEAELEAKQSRDNLQLMMDSLPIGIAVNSVDPNVTFGYMNDEFPKIYGTTREKLEQEGSFWDVVYEDEIYREKIKQRVLNDMSSGNLKNMRWHDVPITKKGQETRYVTAFNTPIPHSNQVISTVIDVTDQKKKEMEVIYTSNHDYLTTLPNRRYFEDVLLTYDHPNYYPLAMMMMDLDGLKLINDALGHEKGNLALRKVSKLLLKHKNKEDFLARIGGDEFIMILSNTNLDALEEKKNLIQEQAAKITIEDLKLSISVGYDMKTDPDKNIEAVINEAENQMYSNKILHGRSARNESIMTIFNALKDKYGEERIHSDQVSQYCKMIGMHLSLRKDELKELELAGLMHDIGKITIPDDILDKPAKLTEDEWKIMKKHTINGYNILKSADKYSRLAEYALTHHEKYDGTGYPNGLQGEDIPLFSRVISVADAYEAMTADRPYRKALSKEIALEEIKRCSGTQFDPRIVEIFLSKVAQDL